MKKKSIGRFCLFVTLLSAVLAGACSSVKMAKNSECVIEEFSIMEYPDVKIDRNDPYIVIHMPEEVSDLHMTPVFTISQGATIKNEGTESGVKRDIGETPKVTVVSEDGLFLSTYKMMAVYPNSRLDFNTIELPQDGEKYGENLAFSFVDFPGTVAVGEPVKWNGFALSNHLAPDMTNPPADLLSWQLYPAESSGRGNIVFAHLGYGAENAVEIVFNRPVNPDSLTIVPSALTVHCMKNGYTDPTGQNIPAMNMEQDDYMLLVLEGYDEDGELLGTKELYIANFSLSERPYIREGWQTLKLNATKLKSIRKMKLYVEGAREAFYPIFGIDKLSYQVQPVATPDEDDEQE